MSEYQVIAFRAVDGPVSEENLAYMERQSSRAEITPWSFDNEYHYGDFRGNTLEMLRRGYDLHLHYANYGTRNIYVRLPYGFPDPRTAAPYLANDSLTFLKDKEGPGGSLSIAPFFDGGDLEQLWDLGRLIDQLVPIRAEILDGDLRPLYIAHLAICCDGNHDPDESVEGPVPAGLDHPTAAQLALAEFLGLDESLLVAAAQGCPALAKTTDPQKLQGEWIRQQPEKKKDEWIARLMAKADPSIRNEILGEFRKKNLIPAWPTLTLNRTISTLQSTADVLERRKKEKAAAAAIRKRATAMAEMARDPAPALQEVDQLVAQRTTHAYKQAGQLLAVLRAALSAKGEGDFAVQHAQKLAKEHPKLRILISELRKQKLLPKK